MTGPRIGSLFSGAGMLDEGVRAAIGGHVVWHCEFDRDASAVLAARYPDVPNLHDVTHVDWSAVDPVDVLTGGYPCQPFSNAGKRKGTDDHRHLWPYFADAIGALRPRLVVLENVAGHLSLGGTVVIGDLARLGYDARWGVVRASDAGAPHRRARLFIVATDADRVDGDGRRDRGPRRGAEPTDRRGATPDADRPSGEARERRPGAGDARRREPVEHRGTVDFGPYTAAIRRWETVLGRPAPNPTAPGKNGPRLAPDFTEFLMGWPAGWTDVGISRNARLRICGNGVVPQQAALALDLLGVPA